MLKIRGSIYMLETFESFYTGFINLAVFFFEIFGVIIIVSSGIKAIVDLFHKKPVQLPFSKGLCLGLLFLLVGEILNSVTAVDLKDLIFIGLLVLIRMHIAHNLNHEIEVKENEQLHELEHIHELEQLNSENK